MRICHCESPVLTEDYYYHSSLSISYRNLKIHKPTKFPCTDCFLYIDRAFLKLISSIDDAVNSFYAFSTPGNFGIF